MTSTTTNHAKNGVPVLLASRAGALANYPHARIANGMVYVSGISSRRPDNSWDGVRAVHFPPTPCLSPAYPLLIPCSSPASVHACAAPPLPQVLELPDGSFKLDIRAQTRAVIEKYPSLLLPRVVRSTLSFLTTRSSIQHILRAAGADLENLVDLTVFLVDMNDYNEFNAVYNEFFPVPSEGPARTTVAVRQLPNPRLLIEIKAVALVPSA
ncbi:hypothetical protein HDU82_004842 [Entophlyctis luteolus]|nr:hypothetical protein HDU82_004842 [Entophlyctis luteolus]